MNGQRLRPDSATSRIVDDLTETGPSTVTQITSRLGYPRRTVSTCLHRAEHRGLVVRGPASPDGVIWSLPHQATVDTGWRDRAACASLDDPSIMFPEDAIRSGRWSLAAEEAMRVRELAAVAVCEPCPVRAECLSYAVGLGVSFDLAGVWGGLTVADRAALRRMIRQDEAS